MMKICDKLIEEAEGLFLKDGLIKFKSIIKDNKLSDADKLSKLSTLIDDERQKRIEEYEERTGAFKAYYSLMEKATTSQTYTNRNDLKLFRETLVTALSEVSDESR